MSSPTVTQATEAFRSAFAPLLKAQEAFARAYERSPRAKREASKAALVALLHALAPLRARVLWASVVATVERVTLEVFSPPLEVALVNSQGPHAPPGCSATKHGALSG